ncbi:hypothetical protein [Saccharopolyspora taberi]|uniref:hypothetical protein n=1 Tax=Saccharopolyspora taberi TaxID=60895 RepID=UPI0031E3AE57
MRRITLLVVLTAAALLNGLGAAASADEPGAWIAPPEAGPVGSADEPGPWL